MDRPGHIIPWGQRTQRPLPDNLAVSNGATGTELPCSRSGDIPGTHRTALTDELGLSVHRLVFVAWASAREPQEFPPGQRRESIRPPLYWRSLVKVLRRFGTEPRPGIVCQNRRGFSRIDRSRVVIPVRQQDRNFAFGFGSTQAIDSQGETVSDGCGEIFLQGLGIDHTSLQVADRFGDFQGSNDMNLGRGMPDAGPLA